MNNTITPWSWCEYPFITNPTNLSCSSFLPFFLPIFTLPRRKIMMSLFCIWIVNKWISEFSNSNLNLDLNLDWSLMGIGDCVRMFDFRVYIWAFIWGSLSSRCRICITIWTSFKLEHTPDTLSRFTTNHTRILFMIKKITGQVHIKDLLC